MTKLAPRSCISRGFAFTSISPWARMLRYRGSRDTPWPSPPRRLAQTRPSATTAASASRAPAEISASRMKRPSSSWPTRMLLRLIPAIRLLRRREIIVEPAAHHGPDPRRLLGEQEVVEAREQVQLGGLAGVLEHFYRLLGGRHRILGGVDQQQRPRRDVADHLLG